LGDMSYLPGTASLLDEIDKRLMIVLRDGRTLIGYLRTIDQFANLVLHRTVERIHVGKQYGDIPRGIFVIRGENVILLGEVDDEKFANSGLEEAPIDDVLEKQRALQIKKQREIEEKKKALRERGLAPSHLESIQEDF